MEHKDPRHGAAREGYSSDEQQEESKFEDP